MAKLKDIPNYEGLYAITTDGKVWGYKGRRNISEKWLSPTIGNHGYQYVVLVKELKEKTVLVHRLVAETYLSKPNNYNYINHKNFNKLDNNVENLEWCTQKMNMEHAAKNAKMARGEEHYRAKLKETDVIEIRQLLNLRISQKEIAKKFRVNQSAISDIKNKVYWGWL